MTVKDTFFPAVLYSVRVTSKRLKQDLYHNDLIDPHSKNPAAAKS